MRAPSTDAQCVVTVQDGDASCVPDPRRLTEGLALPNPSGGFFLTPPDSRRWPSTPSPAADSSGGRFLRQHRDSTTCSFPVSLTRLTHGFKRFPSGCWGRNSPGWTRSSLLIGGFRTAGPARVRHAAVTSGRFEHLVEVEPDCPAELVAGQFAALPAVEDRPRLPPSLAPIGRPARDSIRPRRRSEIAKARQAPPRWLHLAQAPPRVPPALTRRGGGRCPSSHHRS